MIKSALIFSLFLIFSLLRVSYSQTTHIQLPKQMDDVSKFTNVGNIGLTITNFGRYGTGLQNLSSPNRPPSCEYPAGSGIEHLFAGGLWVGGFKKDSINSLSKNGPFITTGAIDVNSLSGSRGGGFEYTNDSLAGIAERSILLDSRYYSPDAISHQDFVMDFTDVRTSFLNGDPIIDHSPFGISVHEETYAWNFPFADFFVIMNYTIKNVSNKYLDSVYVGLWTDAVVRNTKLNTTTNTAFYSHGGNGYDDSLKIAYEFDSDGDVGFTDSYIGFQFLGSTPILDSLFISGNDTLPSVNFVSWQHNSSDPNFFTPQTDLQRYPKMQGYFANENRYGKGINPSTLKLPSNRSVLISYGYFRNIAPGDSINVVFDIICAKKFGTDLAALDTRKQKKNLFDNAEWALRAYYGEDRNRNGILDPGEDNDGNLKVTRYILPTPPTIPLVKVVSTSNKALIYWDNRAENTVDPISSRKDFEGYRIYRTQAGFDISNVQNTLASLLLLAEFDSSSNNIGFNTGFNAVKLTEPMTFPNDTSKYWYKFEVDNLLNGWQYLFSVTAFDEGDVENNLPSLESSLLSNLNRILPGTLPNDDEQLEIGVYPNPYYGNAIWDGSSERLRKIYFYNLPSECEITIYTLSGDIIKKIDHNSLSNGSDLRWFEQYASDGKQKFAGGEHAWDLVTENDQAIATGLYLFTVKNNRTGNIKTGKFLIIK